MPKIHGIIYLIIGIFVAITSYEISYAKLYFFFYIGLLFIIYEADDHSRNSINYEKQSCIEKHGQFAVINFVRGDCNKYSDY